MDQEQQEQSAGFDGLDDVFGAPMSEEEVRFLETRGESDLPSYAPETPETPTPPPAQDAGEPNASETPADSAASDDDEDEVYVDEHGKTRDSKTGQYVKSVPHGAFHKERSRRKEIEAQYQKEVETRARIEGKIEAFNQALNGMSPTNQGQPQAPVDDIGEPVDPNEDIFAAFEQQQKIIAKLQKDQEAVVNQTRQQQEFTHIQNAYVADATKFASETPDFVDAYTHIKEGMHKELELQGYTDANAREAYIKQQELALVQQTLQNGGSPAATIYALAKQRGYSGPAPAQETPATPEIPAKQVAPQQRGKLDGVAKGQQVSATLSGKGSGGNAGLTYEALADMSEDEMYEFSRSNPRAFEKMMRGLG